jgi:hypothetical protein
VKTAARAAVAAVDAAVTVVAVAAAVVAAAATAVAAANATNPPINLGTPSRTTSSARAFAFHRLHQPRLHVTNLGSRFSSRCAASLITRSNTLSVIQPITTLVARFDDRVEQTIAAQQFDSHRFRTCPQAPPATRSASLQRRRMNREAQFLDELLGNNHPHDLAVHHGANSFSPHFPPVEISMLCKNQVVIIDKFQRDGKSPDCRPSSSFFHPMYR